MSLRIRRNRGGTPGAGGPRGRHAPGVKEGGGKGNGRGGLLSRPAGPAFHLGNRRDKPGDGPVRAAAVLGPGLSEPTVPRYDRQLLIQLLTGQSTDAEMLASARDLLAR